MLRAITVFIFTVLAGCAASGESPALVTASAPPMIAAPTAEDGLWRLSEERIDSLVFVNDQLYVAAAASELPGHTLRRWDDDAAQFSKWPLCHDGSCELSGAIGGLNRNWDGNLWALELGGEGERARLVQINAEGVVHWALVIDDETAAVDGAAYRGLAADAYRGLMYLSDTSASDQLVILAIDLLSGRMTRAEEPRQASAEAEEGNLEEDETEQAVSALRSAASVDAGPQLAHLLGDSLRRLVGIDEVLVELSARFEARGEARGAWYLGAEGALVAADGEGASLVASLGAPALSYFAPDAPMTVVELPESLAEISYVYALDPDWIYVAGRHAEPAADGAPRWGIWRLEWPLAE